MRVVMSCCVVLLLFGALSGCAAEKLHGRSTARAESAIEAVPGIGRAEASFERLRSTFTAVDSATVVVHLDTGAMVTDPGKLAEYLLKSLWSIGETAPTELAVFVEAADGTPVDISSGAVENSWSPVLGRSDRPFFLVNNLSREPVKSKLGPWPGPVPPPPVDAIRPREDGGSAQRSRSANAWIAASIPSVSKEPSGLRVK
ncbi:hypothetical protein KNO15_17700 [Leifsonia shinshuensis]|uniref:hypothetical protein n=1 Tax=Leifsonia shinshuensis TaxID=150026 RepID=UPI001F504812|nr:hypothetical protein [Leifsonia shinshuensis]MCI0158540.1 hypothetical protein [Leifsonia shinshuensis]